MTSSEFSNRHVEEAIRDYKAKLERDRLLEIERVRDAIKDNVAPTHHERWAELREELSRPVLKPQIVPDKPRSRDEIIDIRLQMRLQEMFGDKSNKKPRGNDTYNYFAEHIESVENLYRSYDLSAPLEEDFECVVMKTDPPTPVCLHPTGVDVHISYHLKTEGLWEGHMVKILRDMLQENPELGLIDIGANIGVYSLVAAKMGHPVLAVEPYIGNIKRLQKAAQMANITDKITLLQNVISDTRGKVNLTIPYDNQGGGRVTRTGGKASDCKLDTCTVISEVRAILMDDLAPFASFPSAVMKIDIEGHEHVAFAYVNRLLASVRVVAIIMEWRMLRSYYGSEITVTVNKHRTHQMVLMLEARGYVPYSMVTGYRHKTKYWYGWPDDIIWRLEEEDELIVS